MTRLAGLERACTRWLLPLLVGCACGTRPHGSASRRPDGALAGAWVPIEGRGGPSASLLQTAVATGTEVLVWGGSGPCSASAACGDGARFDLATRRFEPLRRVGAPAPRFLHSAVWANGEMLVWGGVASRGLSFGDGAAYAPDRDRWTALAAAGAPSPRGWHSAIFTGTEMLVWGGEDPASRRLLSSGAAYRVATSAWRALPTEGAPSARRYHSCVWTGSEMVIWGGDGDAVHDQGLGDGRRYDPVRDRWHDVASDGAPAARWAHTAVWTGRQMLIWGGLGCSRTRAGEPTTCGDGAAYDPEANAWTPIPDGNGAPSARSSHSAVWTGQVMLVWGGSSDACADGSSGPCADGGAYDPVSRRWSALPSATPAQPRAGHVAVWTGQALFVWGGAGPDGEAPRRDGAIYEAR
jgi:hypothetical protein